MERTRQAKWDKKHISTISARLNGLERKAIDLYCEDHNISVYKLVKDAVTFYMWAYGRDTGYNAGTIIIQDKTNAGAQGR